MHALVRRNGLNGKEVWCKRKHGHAWRGLGEYMGMTGDLLGMNWVDGSNSESSSRKMEFS